MTRLRGVRRSYRGRGEVLAGIDLDLPAGTAVAVHGANGSGESTLLRIAAGATRPTAGTVRDRPPVVGFLPGRVPVSGRLPVRAYLRHMAAVHGRPGRAADAEAVLDALGFAGDAAGPVERLSEGNAQKVGLAGALGVAPGLLVLDEPWSALDADAADALDHLLADAVAGGGTGVAVDLLCARPVLPRIGATVLVALVVVGATAVQPWLPPVGSAALALVRGGVPLAEALVGAALAVVAASVVTAVDRRC